MTDSVPSGNRGPSLARMSIALMVLAIVATVLRLWSRAVTGGVRSSNNIRFWWDDWLACITLPFAVGLCAIVTYWCSIGLGEHTYEVAAKNGDNLTTGSQIFYAGYLIYTTGATLAKYSVLAFYVRVFSGVNNPGFELWVKITTIANTIVWFVTMMVDILQCMPVQKAWYYDLEGTCIDIWLWWLGYGVISIVLDIWILLLPMPVLWCLKLKASRKIVITLLFICGYCVVVVSIGRVASVKNFTNDLEDTDYTIVPIVYWLTTEMSITVLSISLPSILILLKRLSEHGPMSLFSRNRLTPGAFPKRKHLWPSARLKSAPEDAFGTVKLGQDFERLNDGANHEYFAIVCKGPSNATSLDNVELAPIKGIQVRSEVDVVSESVLESIFPVQGWKGQIR